MLQLLKNIIKKRLFYSAKNMSGILCNGIFEINENILKLITNEIHKLTLHNITIVKSMSNDILITIIHIY